MSRIGGRVAARHAARAFVTLFLARDLLLEHGTHIGIRRVGHEAGAVGFRLDELLPHFGAGKALCGGCGGEAGAGENEQRGSNGIKGFHFGFHIKWWEGFNSNCC